MSPQLEYFDLWTSSSSAVQALQSKKVPMGKSFNSSLPGGMCSRQGRAYRAILTGVRELNHSIFYPIFPIPTDTHIGPYQIQVWQPSWCIGDTQVRSVVTNFFSYTPIELMFVIWFYFYRIANIMQYMSWSLLQEALLTSFKEYVA